MESTCFSLELTFQDSACRGPKPPGPDALLADTLRGAEQCARQHVDRPAHVPRPRCGKATPTRSAAYQGTGPRSGERRRSPTIPTSLLDVGCAERSGALVLTSRRA